MSNFFVKGNVEVNPEEFNKEREFLRENIEGRYFIQKRSDGKTEFILKGYIKMKDINYLDGYLEDYAKRTGDAVEGSFLVIPYDNDDVLVRFAQFKNGKKEITELED